MACFINSEAEVTTTIFTWETLCVERINVYIMNVLLYTRLLPEKSPGSFSKEHKNKKEWYLIGMNKERAAAIRVFLVSNSSSKNLLFAVTSTFQTLKFYIHLLF